MTVKRPCIYLDDLIKTLQDYKKKVNGDNPPVVVVDIIENNDDIRYPDKSIIYPKRAEVSRFLYEDTNSVRLSFFKKRRRSKRQ